jgi:hypothetical protein
MTPDTLKPQPILLSAVTQGGIDLRAALSADRDASMLPIVAAGECFAIESAPLAKEAQLSDVPWHKWLLTTAIVGLWLETARKPAYVCYTLHDTMVRLFFCCRRQKYPAKVYSVMRQIPGYIECGSDGFPPNRSRPLAYWEPPCTAVALWPTGQNGETDGPRVVDAGNALAYFSYPELDHTQTVPVDKAGPDYVRVPQEEHVEFKWDGQTFRYINRWADVTIDLRNDQ